MKDVCFGCMRAKRHLMRCYSTDGERVYIEYWFMHSMVSSIREQHGKKKTGQTSSGNVLAFFFFVGETPEFYDVVVQFQLFAP